MNPTPEPLRALLDEAARLREEQRYDEAIALYERAIAVFPHEPEPVQRLGFLYSRIGRLEEAERYLRRALTGASRDPATRYLLANVLMGLGRYPEAWSYYDARFEIEALGLKPPAVDAPRWRSFHPADKQVLIVPEQGSGDQIQMSRFVPRLIAAGAHVTLLATPPLYRLFLASFPAARVIALAGEVSFPQPDFWLMWGDLPGLVGATPETVPNAPYLVAGTPPRLPDGFRIGLMTRGNPELEMDSYRSLPADFAEKLRQGLPGRVIDLAPEATGARDFADTAALIAGLDLVVSVDTGVAHLAGALGKPCLTLVRRFSSDWRWPLGAERSPWYPSLRLFWAELDGSWDGAIGQVIAAAREAAGEAPAA